MYKEIWRISVKNIKLDDYEKDIEENFEKRSPLNTKELKNEAHLLTQAAKNHAKVKQSITIRVNPFDLEAIKLKASKLGVPYQTYLNILFHKEATAL
ncbi:MAG: hypothetical protein KBD83_02840 [Gammaproteobacteria bacterium]|nr:hypothetical protein [Gammaproteobacteria bacterium]